MHIKIRRKLNERRTNRENFDCLPPPARRLCAKTAQAEKPLASSIPPSGPDISFPSVSIRHHQPFLFRTASEEILVIFPSLCSQSQLASATGTPASESHRGKRCRRWLQERVRVCLRVRGLER